MENNQKNNEASSKFNPKRITQAALVLVLIAAGIFLYWLIFLRGIVSSDDARFSGYMIDLIPESSGILGAVEVRAGDRIKKGQKLFQLDPALFQAALAQSQAAVETAKGNLATAQARSEKAFNGARPEEVKAGAAIVARLKNEEDMALLEYNRQNSLLKKGVSTQNQLDRARTALNSAREARVGATENLLMLRKGSRKEDLDAAEADLQTARGRMAEAQAALERAQLVLDRSVVYAPFDGWVVRRWLDPGSMVQPGRPVLSIFDPSTLQVNANIEEKYLHKVKVGDPVEISVDAFPKLHLRGRLDEILLATNSQFSLIPAEGVSGTFIKVTQRIPLRISVQAPPDLPLGPGLSVEIKVRVGGSGSAPKKD
jgi:membrane fusion protein (multidrug efflux system)